MKRFKLPILMLAALLCLTACGHRETPDDTTEATINVTFVAPTEPEETEEPTEEPTEPEETEEETTEPTYSSVVIGTSTKGYVIEERDGCTYVDGILVANKTYSLPSDYGPGELTDECYDAFKKMESDAADEGLDLYIGSGFRSYWTQDSLYNRYCAQDGQAAADTYSARPGHSEHQTGLALDLNDISDSFGETAEGKWVAAHCYEYGFIIRYPADKVAVTGYMYEPWHIRYLGVDTATKVYNSGLCLEEYLGIDSQYRD